MSNKPFSKPKAVVIDDDRAIVAGVKMRLAHAGYEVAVAYEGEGGLSVIRSEKPDVVLLDVRMPDMDGLEVLREIRRDRAHEASPVIMLSASLQDQETALEAGAQYFLRKPYRSGDLLEAVSTVAPIGAS